MKKVEDFMAKDLPEIKENSPLKEIFEAFASSHHNILPVVNSVGKIVGVISLKEILNELLFSRAEVSILEKVTFFADFLTEQIEEMVICSVSSCQRCDENGYFYSKRG